MIDDLIAAAWLYLIVSALALIGTAIWVAAGERKLALHHYVTGKLLGLMLVGWVAWWGSSLSLAPFASPVYLWTLVLMLSALAVALLWRARPRPAAGRWRALAAQILRLELVSLVCFLGYLYLRGFNPHLESTEKFMDLALLTAAARTEVFPFLDFWRAELPINYYYYGYVLLALPLNLGGIIPALGYNMLLGLIFVLALQLSYLLVVLASGSRQAGLLGALLVALAGNLHYATCYLSNIWTQTGVGTACYYPKATRIHENALTINEIPSYSFLLGDLHPHVISIPFFLTGLLVLWHLWRATRLEWPVMALVLFTLASIATVHVWDFMTLGTLLFVLLVARLLIPVVAGSRSGTAPLTATGLTSGWQWRGLARQAGVSAAFLFAVAISPFILFQPFFGQFESPVAGLGFAPTFVRVANLVGTAQYPAEPMFMLGLWGAFAILIGLSLIILWGRWSLFGPGIQYALLLAGMAVGLIVFTELFFFRDFFHLTNPSHFRTNTVFKLGYHAWMLLAIATAILLHAAWRLALREEPAAERILSVAGFMLLSAVLIFPLEGARQVFAPVPPWSLGERDLTLEGGRFIADKNPDDWATIRWLRDNIQGRPVLLEAVGNSYSYGGRIGVFSGAINPINWSFHQWTWRFSYPPDATSWEQARARAQETGIEPARAVEADVRALYEARERGVAIELSRTLGLDYLYIGDLERSTYAGLNEPLLRTLGPVVHSSGDSLLIRVDPDVMLETELQPAATADPIQ